MSEFHSDELVHTLLHMSQLQQGVRLPFVWAHVAEYDPSTHTVRCLIPIYREGSSAPTLTGWLPVMPMMAGPNVGIQYAFKGGASYSNPTNGELVLVLILDDAFGAYVAIGPWFNSIMTPPSQVVNLSPGELLIRHADGQYIYLKNDGSISLITSSGAINLTTGSNPINLTTGSGQSIVLTDILKHTGSKVGLYNVAPVTQPTIDAAIAGSTGGAATGAFVVLTGTYTTDVANIANMLAQVQDSLNKITNALTGTGLAHT